MLVIKIPQKLLNWFSWHFVGRWNMAQKRVYPGFILYFLCNICQRVTLIYGGSGCARARTRMSLSCTTVSGWQAHRRKNKREVLVWERDLHYMVCTQVQLNMRSGLTAWIVTTLWTIARVNTQKIGLQIAATKQSTKYKISYVFIV